MAQVDVHITARDEQVDKPWIWRLSRDFNLVVNIVRANVDADMGWIHLRLDGPVEEIQRATAFLNQSGMHVDAKQRSVQAG
ncbi:MAG: NIL domain-containing protein [Fimbriimonadaceae bacterium]|nr:NIL domain-containing protein [Fimbriimonadaceae bacterium]